MNIDQDTYDDLVAEASTLFEHLDEWHEQFAEDNGEESAVRNAMACISQATTWLNDAKRENDRLYQEKRDALIEKIATGATTRYDAIVARGMMS